MTKREVIEIPGVSHGTAPIPMGAKIGSIVCSSAIMGMNPETNELPLEPEIQLACLFRNIETFMEQAGGGAGNIIRMSVYLKDNNLRKLLNDQWLAMFPEESDRPARHITIQNELRNGMIAQVEIIAVV